MTLEGPFGEWRQRHRDVEAPDLSSDGLGLVCVEERHVMLAERQLSRPEGV